MKPQSYAPPAAVLAAAAIIGSASVAKADLMIIPNGGEQDRIDDAGGTTGTGNPFNQPPQGNGLPLGLTGYNSQIFPIPNPLPDFQGPSLVAVKADPYTFTYMGSGNAVDHDTFTFMGHTFDNESTAPGTSFTVNLAAGTNIDFLYKNLTAGTSVSDDANPSPGTISYFLGLDHSDQCAHNMDPLSTCDLTAGGDALTGPSFQFAYIGLSDLPWFPTGGDHDFQDLGVLVREAPEPASLALLGSALFGLAAFGLRRKKKQV